jgi:Phage integrase family.
MAKARKLKSGNWNIQILDYIDDNGKRHVASFTAPTKAEVEYMAAVFRKEKKQRPKQDRRNKKPRTVGNAIDEYIALSETLSPATLDTYRKIRRFAFPSIIDRNIDELTDLEVQAAINIECKRQNAQTGKPVSARTVRNEWGLFSSALKAICGKSFNVKLPKNQPNVETLPDPETIINTIRGTEIELPCLLAMWMGLRMSEIKGLTFGAFRNGCLYIDQTMIYAYGRDMVQENAKTATSKRKLAVPEYISKLIEAEKAERLKTCAKEEIKDQFIVPASRNVIHHRFTRLMEKQGIKMSFHDLRHLFASISLTMLGIPAKAVQVSGGWASSYIMDRVYSQTFDPVQQAADRKREEYFTKILHNDSAQSQ